MNSNQLLDIVDENDKIIGRETKDVKFEKELISRNVAVFLKNSNGKYIIVKRSPNKKTYPNLLDLAACGNVDLGETYEQAINREIKEELGVNYVPRLLKKIYYEDITKEKKKVKFFTSIFTGTINAEKINCNEEHSIYRLLSLEELKQLVKNSPELFVPFFISDFNAVKDQLE